MKPREWLTLLAYVLLVAVVAWSTYETQRVLEDIEEEVCVAGVAAFIKVDSDDLNRALGDDIEAINDYERILVSFIERCNPVLGIDEEP